ncbi:hypothetical protein H4582DRAFT_1894657 [Lactarius indigo]|nr:hypothetical protein H4582DRAFT_1894657 [Lactarius indigo]
MTRRIREQRDPVVRVIGCCVAALVVNKLAADISSHVVPVGDEELACLSAILDTETHNVILWLRHPGAIELAGIVSLALEVVCSLVADTVPSHVQDVVQQTLDFISQALPVEGIAHQSLDQTIDLINASDSNFELIVSSNLQKFLELCISNTSPLRELRTSCLRLCLKSLWCFVRLYHRRDGSIPFPSYFPLVHASPEITHLVQTEPDPITRVIGRCFEALVVVKLVEDTNSLTDEDVVFLSGILGKESHIVWLWLDQPGAIDLRNVISVISDEVHTFSTDKLPADVLEIFQQTLSIIARDIARGRRSADEDLYMDQVLYFHSICSMVADRGGPNWLKYRLEWILSQLPSVEDRNLNRWRQSDLISDGQLSEYGIDNSSLRSGSDTTG